MTIITFLPIGPVQQKLFFWMHDKKVYYPISWYVAILQFIHGWLYDVGYIILGNNLNILISM